jgi:tetratricopeptide (TPR) repeat protein
LEHNAIELLRDAGDAWHMGLLLGILGLALRRSGQIDRAEEVCKEALATLADLESSSHPLGLVKMCMAEIARDRGDRRIAKLLYYDALQRLRDAGSFPSTAFALVGLASLEAMEGEVEKAAVVCGALEGIGGRLKAEPVAPCNRSEYEETLARVRATLSADSLRQVWARGRAMSEEQVIAFALADAD